MNTSYQFGIEEEYFLADAMTRGTPRQTVKAFHEAARTRLPQVERELLQSQIEVSTPPSTSFAETREVLAGMRAGLSEVGQGHGILVLAAGTHPVARWTRQTNTQKDRYGHRSLMAGSWVKPFVWGPGLAMGGPCRIMVLSAVGVCRRMMASEALAS